MSISKSDPICSFGSPVYPRGMGPLIRLCLHYGVQLWFIPPSEPWWNGVVEKFNDHYQQKFLDKIIMASMPQLRQESLAFEQRHNSTYRYSKLKGNLLGQTLELTFRITCEDLTFSGPELVSMLHRFFKPVTQL